MAFIVAHPAQFVRLLAMKFYAFWWFSSHSGTLYAPSWLLSYKAFYAGSL